MHFLSNMLDVSSSVGYCKLMTLVRVFFSFAKSPLQQVALSDRSVGRLVCGEAAAASLRRSADWRFRLLQATLWPKQNKHKIPDRDLGSVVKKRAASLLLLLQIRAPVHTTRCCGKHTGISRSKAPRCFPWVFISENLCQCLWHSLVMISGQCCTSGAQPGPAHSCGSLANSLFIYSWTTVWQLSLKLPT